MFECALGVVRGERAGIDEKIMHTGRHLAAASQLDHWNSGESSVMQRALAAARPHAMAITDTHEAGQRMRALQLRDL